MKNNYYILQGDNRITGLISEEFKDYASVLEYVVNLQIKEKEDVKLLIEIGNITDKVCCFVQSIELNDILNIEKV